MSDLERKTQALLKFVQSEPNYVKVLETLTRGGLVTLDQVKVLTGLSLKIARTSLENLIGPPRRIPSALRSAPVKLASKTGRPQNAYLPTPEGAEVLRSLFPDARQRAYQVHDPIDISALYCMMEVYTAACQAGLQAEIEKVLPYGAGLANIRADIWVQSTASPGWIFEIEQQLPRNNLPRVVEKLLHLRGLFTSAPGAGCSPQVRILFNLPAEENDHTLTAWCDALASVTQQIGELPYQLYWQPLQDFLQAPEWNTLKRFRPLEPSQPPARPEPRAEQAQEPPKPEATEPKLRMLELATPPDVDLQELKIVLMALDITYQEEFSALVQTSEPRQRSQNFFSLMTLIYTASHYKGSDTLEYAVFPLKSLRLLFRYLNAHQNLELFEQLRQAMPNLQYQASVGIIGFRNALTKFFWDIFLRWHGLARGGPLKVVVQVPDFQDRRSEFYVMVRIENHNMVGYDRHYEYTHSRKFTAETALAWVLEALFLYAYELGLNDKPGSRPRQPVSRKTAKNKNTEVENGSLNDD
ncbi:MAG: hypothetical protein AB1894_11310 [Chloroflexota bacterium]